MPLAAKSLITTVAGVAGTCCAIGVPLTLVDGGQTSSSNVVTLASESPKSTDGGGHSVKETDEKLAELTDYLIGELQSTSASTAPTEISVQKENGKWSYKQLLTTGTGNKNENLRTKLSAALEYVLQEWTDKQWSSTWSGQYWGTSWIDSSGGSTHNVVMTGVDSTQKKHILLKQDLNLNDSKSYVVGSYEVKSESEGNVSVGELSLGVKNCQDKQSPQCQIQKRLEDSEVRVKLKFVNS